MKKMIFVLAIVLLLIPVGALAGGGETYYVCHVTADHTYPYAHYNYLELGSLNGHFYFSNPDLPKHGAFSMAGGHLHWVADFVTVQGDYDCDGQVDYQPCDEQTDWIFFSQSTEEKPNGFVVTKYVYLKYDARDQETVCDQMVAVDRQYVPLPPDVQLENDCDGYAVYYIPDTRKPDEKVLIQAGEWGPKDVLEMVDVDIPQLELTLTVKEPAECFECVVHDQIWIWDLYGPNGEHYTLKDSTYDGSLAAPGLAMQRFYLGCEWFPASVGGHYVTNCDSTYQYWNTLPYCNGGGKCPLP